MKIGFYGAAHEVTGSCHLIQVGDKNCLIDCGMEQGADIYENQELPVKASDIDYVFVTHAHIDHSGLLPLLYLHGFKGQIFSTNATYQLCVIMLKDSAHIQEQEAMWKNRKNERAGREKVEPMYTVMDAEATLQMFVPCPYNKEMEICDEITIRFGDAGHLLGSSFVEIWAHEDGKETKIVFSGDLGNGNRPLLKDPQVPESADYLVIESTYGDRLHDMPKDFAPELANILMTTFEKGGNVVIPAFSVGRTQEMLYHLRRIKTEHMMSSFEDFEVYVDSPMSVAATSVFNANVLECFNEKNVELIRSGVNPITFPGLNTTTTSEESVAINFLKKPIVIISASGMCEAGRIRHHLKHNLWRSECTVVFVGYQVPGTLGFNLLHGAEKVKLFGEDIQVRATITNLPGMSGHADMNHLTDWVAAMPSKPKQIFVVHGEDSVTDGFAAHLTEAVGVPALAPYSGDSYDLDTMERLSEGSRKRAEKKEKGFGGVSAVFQQLLDAAARLMGIVKNSSGLNNKDLKKFTKQINDICDHWDHK